MFVHLAAVGKKSKPCFPLLSHLGFSVVKCCTLASCALLLYHNVKSLLSLLSLSLPAANLNEVEKGQLPFKSIMIFIFVSLSFKAI